MRILLVEDETRLATAVVDALQREDFSVQWVTTAEDALPIVTGAAFDAIILDVMLPGMSGFDACRALRRQGLDTPVIILSARSVVEDRVTGLDSGADDYLTKPFAMIELSARLRSLLRRRQPSALSPLRVGDLSVDPVTRMVTRGGRRVDLTQKEFALLEYLMRHAGQAVTRAMIAESVWGLTWDRLTNVIDVFVTHLRKKLEDSGDVRLIHAVRGVGYVIRANHGD
jgi:two-component system, OmpR family, copper resistance phosphate regulon response regulator CusR